MDEKQKSQLIAEAENVEAIRDFFVEWYDLEDLYETMAKACTTIIYLANKNLLCVEDKRMFEKLMMQHEMMIEHMKPFAKKDEPEQ